MKGICVEGKIVRGGIVFFTFVTDGCSVNQKKFQINSFEKRCLYEIFASRLNPLYLAFV